MNSPQHVESFDWAFRKAKDHLRLTFQEAAERLRVSKKTLENWLVRPPNVHRRRAIVDAKAFALLLARVAALGIDAATASMLVGGKREG